MTALHPLHRAWRLLPAGARRSALARAAALLAPRPDQKPPAAQAGIVVGGEIGRASGLGEGARLMQAALQKMGVPVWPIEAGLFPPGKAAGISLPPAGAPLIIHVNAPLLAAALWRLPKGMPAGRRIIGYWAWELAVASPGWRAGARFVHEIWTPSRFSADALAPLAPGRVHVVPHPVATCPPQPSALGRADFGLPDHTIIVLVSFSLASSFERKNPLAAIAAFREAFGDRPDRMLLLKIGHSEHEPADLARLQAAIAGAANIRLETRMLPAADNHALTQCADIVLSLHRSEGFGLVPAEAMLLGRPVIATDFSATTEFMDADSGVPIPYRLVPARDPRRVFEAPGALWAEADIAAAAAALRSLANDANLRATMGQAGRRAAQDKLGSGALAAAVQRLGLPVPAAA